MKKIFLPIFLLILWQSIAYSQGNSAGLTFRPFAKIGFTAATPTLEELGYMVIGGPGLSDDTRQLDRMAYGFGLEALYGKGGLKFGIEAGFTRLFKNEVTLDNSDVHAGISNYVDKESAIQVLLVAHSRLAGIFFIEGGIGAHLTFWTYDYEYLGVYGNESSSDGGMGTNFGLMAAGGVELPLTENLSIPLFARMDVLFRYGIMVPLTFNAGFNFKF